MKKRPKRIYCDTSLFGGLFDREFELPSRRFFDLGRQGVFHSVISAVVDAELSHPGTPDSVFRIYEEFLAYSEIVPITESAILLQTAYIKEKILTPQWEDDALHVALASVHSCDMIVSWNFKHIVNFRKIPLYNAVNALHGYGPIDIYSPLEVINYDD